jgi:hypothetical protein
MTSFLFKCIPCARSGKVPISENDEESQPQRLYTTKSNVPIEDRIYHTTIQQTPTAIHARGYEIVEMDITGGTENGINTDIKTTK